ncbi:DUF6990 domain-containing protein [Basilea psittacipulmonis]|uniref:Uncharacterized protein n=1 Tax=Basilea psittacipulmonis DSM 24701 TaxID=1072685 RepID=A0A077DGC6_9BURK|nr:hypothetical protein [Basilea psittacipulmonis]AIL33216.1 hypothetical protein IX83_07830 [Basilea psittacipulmonis DSM 24701]
MDIEAVKAKLVSQGWTYDPEEIFGQVLEECFWKMIEGVQVYLYLEMQERDDGCVEFSLGPAISTQEFQDVRNYVMQESFPREFILARSAWWCMAPETETKCPATEFKEVTDKVFDEVLESSLEWVRCQDVDKALEYYANLSTNQFEKAIAKHLAALVIRGEKEKLLYYQKCFAEGNRLDFISYVTDEAINRAVELVMKK